MATGRTTNARLINNIDVNTIMVAGEWNKLTDGIDRQLYNIGRYIGGNGIITGGEILTSKQVGPTRAVIDGFVGYTSSNQAISSLVNNKANSVWCVRVDNDDPTVSTTFNSGVMAFIAQDAAPSHGFYLGTITLDSGGTVTAVDNVDLLRPTVLPQAVQTWTGSVTVTGLAEGDSVWVEVDHSDDVTFRAVSLCEWTSIVPSNDAAAGTWVVTGAGDSNYNGTYTVAGQIGGVDYYSNGSRYLVSVGPNTWFLATVTDPTPFTAEYTSSGTTPATTDGAWSVAPGGSASPAPTVAAPALGGFEVQQIENCRSDKFGFMLYNVGSTGQTYYNVTECTVYWSRTGIV